MVLIFHVICELLIITEVQAYILNCADKWSYFSCPDLIEPFRQESLLKMSESEHHSTLSFQSLNTYMMSKIR